MKKGKKRNYLELTEIEDNIFCMYTGFSRTEVSNKLIASD